jgi:hypothetical protein
MTSLSDTAVATAIKFGAALLKFVSPNDCGLTGSHQRGFYLPKKAWEIFTPKPPVRGENYENDIKIEWHDGRITQSKIKWYGKAKNEFRLTSFGRERDFPFLRDDKVGSLLVFVPGSPGEARCFMLEAEEDMQDVQSALGVDATVTRWGIFDASGIVPPAVAQPKCIEAALKEYVAQAEFFPSTAEVSMAAISALRTCSPQQQDSPDNQLENAIKAEYRLFQLLESKFVVDSIRDGFPDMQSFITVAQSVLQRRKSRAGRSLEFHVEEILSRNGIPFQSQAVLDGTRPDLVIPNSKAYYHPSSCDHEPIILALKTTCKDRWRQILQEAPRVKQKYLLTLQPGITTKQTEQMIGENVQLVVPKYLHSQYEPGLHQHLMTFDCFVKHVHTYLVREDYTIRTKR